MEDSCILFLAVILVLLCLYCLLLLFRKHP